MIRYTITKQALLDRIQEHDATWLAKASDRTDRFRQLGQYHESSGIWGDIKPVYMQIQRYKCAYCERKLEGAAGDDVDFGRIEHDVEHYRPKRKVVAWPPANRRDELAHLLGLRLGAANDKGYYLLAYSPLNYLASCKTCNSTLKGNYFPIAGRRNTRQDDPARLTGERPYLPYPLTDLDDDPESLITFRGISPVAVAQDGPRRRRALVTIAFFKLDTREELLRGRAVQLQRLGFVLLTLENTADDWQRTLARRAIDQIRSDSNPHAACVRAFHALYQDDRNEAMDIFELITSYLNSQS